MKYLSATLLSFLIFSVPGQSQNPAPDNKEWKPPYTLKAPKDWGIERFPIPIAFAPQIPYQGVEDIRFAPGWGDAKSDAYWTYAFLWYLDGRQKIDSKVLASHLKAYYTGLIAANLGPASTGKHQPVSVKIKKVKTAKGDTKTFQGEIQLLDYMAKKPITLHGVVHSKRAPKQDKTLLFFQLSPKPFGDPIWRSLDELWAEFVF